MKQRTALYWLILLTGILALAASAAGLLWQAGDGPFTFTSLHHQLVAMDGQGLYRNDTLFNAATFRGTDIVTLIIGLPLLLVTTLLNRRGSLRGGFLLAGALSYFLYISASMALGAAYNSLFLLYVAYFSASLFAFILAFTSIDLQRLPEHISLRLPRRGIGWFLIAFALVLIMVWLSDVLVSISQGRVPELLGSYTTMVTYVLDLGIIAPVLILSGVWVLRRVSLGYLTAAVMLILGTMIGLMVIGQTVVQILSGITLSPGEFIGYVGSFVIMSLINVWVMIALLRNIQD